MKRVAWLFLVVLLARCGTGPQDQLRGIENMWAGDWLRNASLKRAIVYQHTLYPYHFVVNSAERNALGDRDLAVLLEHFKTAPGELCLFRGDTPDPLFQKRVEATLAELKEHGLERTVKVTQGIPDGSGMWSERLTEILDSNGQDADSETGLLGSLDESGGAQ